MDPMDQDWHDARARAPANAHTAGAGADSEDEGDFEDFTTADQAWNPDHHDDQPPATAHDDSHDDEAALFGDESPRHDHDHHHREEGAAADAFSGDAQPQAHDDEAALFGDEDAAGDEAELFGTGDEPVEDHMDLDDTADLGRRGRSPRLDDRHHDALDDDDMYGHDGDHTLAIDSIPMIPFPSEKPTHLLDMPNFLHLDSMPFDPDHYDAGDPEELKQHEVDLRVANTMRWRFIQNDAHPDRMTVQSNAQLVKWSDGTYSLLVGDEYFDVTTQPVAPYQYLTGANHSSNTLHVHRVLDDKLVVKPMGARSKTHKKMAAALAMRFKRTDRVKVTHVTKDPEKERQRKIAAAQEAERSRKKLEKSQRAASGRYGVRGGSSGGPRGAGGGGYSDEEEDVGGAYDDNFDVNDYGAGSSSAAAGGARRSNAHDDLGGFVVDDEEDLVEYDEDDEEEERQYAQPLSSRRSVGEAAGAKRALEERKARMRGPAAGDGYGDMMDEDEDEDDAAAATSRSRRSKRRAVMSDEDDDY
ncbi:hypothetical protein AMAG_04248 [Allomyces macrogynus ATCC 38327]|uniref:Leo1-like protein n=1 Tax=Allomyces macrogynus (strain ATCC 38327) TaxID=578462 RepID=A0A0L0S8I9_ALLM3|nr:hypothetical protein AMAG_04248 [Allomyces macrogynus ATCC 38327]|eukprot:KNE58694.1 hypothetical protein AMAG_04248 [Allomyces macrogynus ATCC 38327]